MLCIARVTLLFLSLMSVVGCSSINSDPWEYGTCANPINGESCSKDSDPVVPEGETCGEWKPAGPGVNYRECDDSDFGEGKWILETCYCEGKGIPPILHNNSNGDVMCEWEAETCMPLH